MVRYSRKESPGRFLLLCGSPLLLVVSSFLRPSIRPSPHTFYKGFFSNCSSRAAVAELDPRRFGLAGDGPESERVQIGIPLGLNTSRTAEPGGLALVGRLAGQYCGPHPCGPERTEQELSGLPCRQSGQRSLSALGPG